MDPQALKRPAMAVPVLLRPLRDPALALLWGGLAASAVGDQLFAVVLAWIAVGVLGTAAGYLTAMQAAVVLTTALLGGRWADRRGHRRLMIAADLGRATVLAGLIAAWLLTGTPKGCVDCVTCGSIRVSSSMRMLFPRLERLQPVSKVICGC